MSNLFIPSNNLSDYYNLLLKNKLLSDRYKYKHEYTYTTSDNQHDNMSGYVYCIHETKDGKKELINDNNNHIVLVGRKWLMQRAIGASINADSQNDWFIQWFGIGNGGTNASDPLNPLYTSDTKTDLSSPIKIYNSYSNGYTYSDNGYKKTFKKYNGNNAQMKFDTTTNEVIALFHLVVDYNDCPYEAPKLGVSINELALYASPSENSSEENFIMFSRYCMPTKYKSNSDKLSFLWYLYF